MSNNQMACIHNWIVIDLRDWWGHILLSIFVKVTTFSSLRSITLQWCHNDHHGVSNHLHSTVCLNVYLNYHQRQTKPVLLALCEWNPPVTGGFPSQMASNAENVPMEWRHHDMNVGACHKIWADYICCFFYIRSHSFRWDVMSQPRSS